MIRVHLAETTEDIEQIKRLLEEYVASWFDFEGPVNEEEVKKAYTQIENLPHYFGPPNGCLLLAKYGDEVAGCVALESLNDRVCQMKRLYVRPTLRRLQIGRELSEHVIEHARENGFEYMRIHTISGMIEAIGLYKSLGFSDIDPYENSPREDAVFMELKLERK